ncbi:MAG: DUF3108 domain-containing protein [Proteobacteria bacterium]|nr:DUF3108 domain-containing protein [Pseudomonadota bacterium]
MLTAAVLLVHWAALAWLESEWHQPKLITLMVAPMLTREIAPATPPRISATNQAAAKAEPSQHAPNTIVIQAPVKKAPTPRTSARKPTAEKPRTEPAPQPKIADAASAPAPESPSAPAPADQLAAAAQPAASAPQPAASATPIDGTALGSGVKPLDGTAAAPGSDQAYLDGWPADTRIRYALGGYYRGALSGDAQVLWQRSGDKYQARIEVDVGILLSMSLTSQGKITPTGLHPQLYEEQVRGRRRIITMDAQTVTLPSGRQVPRPPGLEDTISQFIDLGYQFATGRTQLQVGHPFQLWLARPGGVDLWTYNVPEEVAVPTEKWGPVPAFHLEPRPPAGSHGDVTLELWFAPSLQYLPVRVRLNLDKENYLDLVAQKIEQR